MKIALANDHAAYPAREDILAALRQAGHEVLDFGSDSSDPVDYADFAEKACLALRDGQAQRAVLLCGTGQGMVIAANKMPGIRAARCLSEEDARLARAHNDSNALCLRGGWGREKDQELAAILAVWLETDFEGGRHRQRVDKIAALEKRYGGLSVADATDGGLTGIVL
jgi:ribose 5-phosphate isomerase B